MYNSFMNKLNIYFTIVCDKEILLKSFKIALVVGSILNIINQGDKILALDFQNLNHIKSILTYIVPFMVSTYTALSIKMKFKIGEITPVGANLKCKGCGNTTHVEKNSFVLMCDNCKEKTKWRIK